MKKELAVLLVGCMVAGLAGCGSRESMSGSAKDLTEVIGKQEDSRTTEDTEKKEVSSERKEEYADSYDDLAVTLLQEVYKKGENAMISPLSILTALTMTENGASGNTLEQMQQVLADGMDVEMQDQILKDYILEFTGREKAKLDMANSIWLKETDHLHVDEAFLQKNRDYFGAEVFKAPFDDRTLKDINSWVSDKTEKKIPEMLDKIEDDAVLYLINAVAFDAKWENPYEDYDLMEREFTEENGTVTNMTMMYSEEELYLEDENTTGFIRPYEDGYQFVAMLPSEGMTMEEYLSQLNGEKIKKLIDGATDAYTVYAGVPKFSSEYTVELKDVLEHLGMTDAFDEEKADFSKMATSDQGNLSIDMVLHKTFIEVDDQGTKAAAATVVGVAETASLIVDEVKEVYLNRPFVYAIVDEESHLPVFFGVTEKISE